MNYSHKVAVKTYKPLKQFEQAYNITINKKKFYFIRFDGVKMTKNFLNGQRKKLFLYTFKTAIEIFLTQNPNIKIAYSYADELSVFLNEDVLKEHDYRLEKIVSIYTSKLTAAFYIAAKGTSLELGDHIYSFDGRLIALDSFDNVINYLKARQIFSISRHFLKLKSKYLKNLDVVNNDEIIIELSKLGFDYYRTSFHERYGLLWIDNRYERIYEFCLYESKLRQQVLKYISKGVDVNV